MRAAEEGRPGGFVGFIKSLFSRSMRKREYRDYEWVKGFMIQLNIRLIWDCKYICKIWINTWSKPLYHVCYSFISWYNYRKLLIIKFGCGKNAACNSLSDTLQSFDKVGIQDFVDPSWAMGGQTTGNREWKKLVEKYLFLG